MFILKKTETYSQEIKKSRFLAICGQVDDEQAARDFIEKHSNASANHNCWAWRVGQNYRFNDDGEPGGTAGKPILQAIDGQSLDHVVAVVTRWFGGTLLGSGGLIRAYGGTAALCLRQAEKAEIIATVEARIVCDFSDLALIKARLAAQAFARVIGEEFTPTGAELTVSIAADSVDRITTLITDLTRARAAITVS
ncbi:MAG: IMPACT family protein [Phyllobacterium sp.]